MTPTVKAILVNRTNPSGIIPTIPATLDNMASLYVWPLKKYWDINKRMPVGIIKIVTIFNIELTLLFR